MITSRTPAKTAARWMKNAVGRLDRLADEEIRAKIMERCGRACIDANATIIPRVKARRQKCASEDDFLAAECRRPLAGTKIERRGDALFHTYTPRAYRYPMRCYCPLGGALAANETMSPTYCLCSKAYLKRFWEEALGRPLEVEVLETALTGSTECRFRIDLAAAPKTAARPRKTRHG